MGKVWSHLRAKWVTNINLTCFFNWHHLTSGLQGVVIKVVRYKDTASHCCEGAGVQRDSTNRCVYLRREQSRRFYKGEKGNCRMTFKTARLHPAVSSGSTSSSPLGSCVLCPSTTKMLFPSADLRTVADVRWTGPKKRFLCTWKYRIWCRKNLKMWFWVIVQGWHLLSLHNIYLAKGLVLMYAGILKTDVLSWFRLLTGFSYTVFENLTTFLYSPTK